MEVNIRIAMIMIDSVLTKITITITISIIMWFAFVTDSTMKSRKKSKRTKYKMVDDDDYHHDYVLGE